MQACALNSLDMVNLLLDHAVEKDAAAFELLRGQTALLIRARLKLEEGDGDEGDGSDGSRPAKPRGDGVGAWVLYKEVCLART